MSDTNADVVRQFLTEVIGKKDLSARPDLLASDFIAHFGGMPALDLAAWKPMVLGFRHVPDLRWT